MELWHSLTFIHRNSFHNKTILISNTGKSILQIYRAHSENDAIPLKSVDLKWISSSTLLGIF